MDNKINVFKKDLDECIRSTNFDNFSLLMLHVKLKTIKKFYKESYEKLTGDIINSLKKTKPKNIIVPAFTYSFTEKKCFDNLNSRSEVGKFSEVFRLKHSVYRTNDPLFSLAHTENYNNEYRELNKLAAFTKDSVWKYLFNNNVTIVNIGLSPLIISLIHYIEFLCDVPYRKIFILRGMMIENNKKSNISYTFYARDKNSKYGLNWDKIERDLKTNKLLKYSDNNILNFNWIKAKDLSKFIMLKIKSNPYYLVHKID